MTLLSSQAKVKQFSFLILRITHAHYAWLDHLSDLLFYGNNVCIAIADDSMILSMLMISLNLLMKRRFQSKSRRWCADECKLERQIDWNFQFESNITYYISYISSQLQIATNKRTMTTFANFWTNIALRNNTGCTQTDTQFVQFAWPLFSIDTIGNIATTATVEIFAQQLLRLSREEASKSNCSASCQTNKNNKKRRLVVITSVMTQK